MRPSSFCSRCDPEFLHSAATFCVECLCLAYPLVPQFIFAGHGEKWDRDLRRVNHEPAPYVIDELFQGVLQGLIGVDAVLPKHPIGPTMRFLRRLVDVFDSGEHDRSVQHRRVGDDAGGAIVDLRQPASSVTAHADAVDVE